MSRIHAEQLVYLAAGIPEVNAAQWQKTLVGTLERRGFAVIVMTPEQIVEQAEHIKQTYERAKEQT